MDGSVPKDGRLRRRTFHAAALGTAAVATGCKPCFAPESPRAWGKPTQQGPRTFTLRVLLTQGHYTRVRALLDDPTFNPFSQSAHGIHYARFFLLDHSTLVFMVIYDEFSEAMEFLAANAEGVDRIFRNCESYPPAGANDPRFEQWTRDHLLCVQLFYRAYDESQDEVRSALQLRDDFIGFVQRTEAMTDAEFAGAYADFIDDALPEAVVLAQEKDDPSRMLSALSDTPVTLRPPVIDRTNPFTLYAPVHPERIGELSRIFRLGTWVSVDLNAKPLKELPTLHFARVSILENNYLMFASVYDGDFIQYVEDFGTRIADDIDRVFGACIGYPKDGARNLYAFKQFLRAYQIPTRAFAGSYLDRSLLEIQASLELAKDLAHFIDCYEPTHPRLRRRFHRFLHKQQDRLS